MLYSIVSSKICSRDSVCPRGSKGTYSALIVTIKIHFHLVCAFLAIFRNEITTILTPSTSEAGEGEVKVVTFFVLELPDYKSTMLIYLYIYMEWLKVS